MVYLRMKFINLKEFKGLRKESLRDNMTDIEVALTDLGNIAKITRDNLEKELGRIVISNKNSLHYEYIDDVKQIKNNKSEE